MQLNLTALGPFQFKTGQANIKQRLKNKMIQQMIRQFTHSHSLSTLVLSNHSTEPAEFQRANGQLSQSRRLLDRGKLHPSIIYLSLLTGEIWMVVIGSPGPRTNIFHNIAVHAGHKAPPQQLLIDLTFLTTCLTQLQLVSTLRLLLTTTLVEAVTVEIQLSFTSLLTTTVSLTALACNMLHTTCKLLFRILICAETAPGHHPHQAMMVLPDAGPCHTASTT